MKLLASNAKAAVYTDSDIDSIECPIGPEEIKELTTSNYVTPDSIGNVRKVSTGFAHRGGIFVPGPVAAIEFARNIFGARLNFNLVFEYHEDTRVSDILALFDPSIKNKVNSAVIKDSFISEIQSCEELAAGISTICSLLEPNFGRKFLENHRINRIVSYHANEDYNNYDFIYFVPFPSIHFLKKYNQYYIYSDCVDFHGKEFSFCYLQDCVGYKSYDPYFSYGLEPITDIVYINNNLYLQLKSNTSYVDRENFEAFKELLRVVNENVSYLTYKDQDYSSTGVKVNYKALNFDYKIKIAARDCNDVLIKILNKFRHIYSSGFNPRGPNGVKNIVKSTYSINDLVRAYTDDSKNIKTVDFRPTAVTPKHLDLLASVNGKENSKFKDVYTLEILRLPLFSCESTSDASDWFSDFIADQEKINPSYTHEITKNIKSFYTNLYSGKYSVDKFTIHTSPGHITTSNSFNAFNGQTVPFPYYDSLVAMFHDVANVSLFTSVATRKKLLNCLSKLKYVESAYGEQSAVLLAKDGVPSVVRSIQHTLLNNLIQKSTKGSAIADSISNPSAAPAMLEKYTKIIANHNITNKITIDSKYYSESAVISKSLKKENISFGPRTELFQEIFMSAFYGNGISPGVVEILSITDAQLENPSKSLTNLFMGMVSIVSFVIRELLLHPNPKRSRNFYGISDDYIGISFDIENRILNKIIPSISYNTIGSYTSTGSLACSAKSQREVITRSMYAVFDSFREDQVVPRAENLMWDRVCLDRVDSDIINYICFTTSHSYRTSINTKSHRGIPSRLPTTLIGNRISFDVSEVLVIGKR